MTKDYGDLESILRNGFGCKKPFLKKPKLLKVDSDGEKTYEYFTKKGADAFDKLTDVVYGLEEIGVIENAHDIVETLDEIVTRDW